jgi:VWFA-related protein
MRAAIALFLALVPIAAHAADTPWRDILARANSEKKPIVIFFRADPCAPCAAFERTALPHPAIQRRLPSVVFATLPASAGETSGVALFDRAGVLRARWAFVPGTMNFGVILDSAIAVAPQFERAVQLCESGDPDGGEVAAAIGLALLGRVDRARAALQRSRPGASPETQQAAIVANAVLDAAEGKSAPAPPSARPAQSGAIRILPLSRQIVSGRQKVKTNVTSTAIARVSFSLDGKEIQRVGRPPFSATLDFGPVPERRAIQVVAFDRNGRAIGRDERIVDEAGETFRVRLVTPREGAAGGAVPVELNVRAPATRRVERIAISWNDADRAVLTAPPWQAILQIPEGQLGVLRAVAELDDGRTSEDTALLNAGIVGQVDVQLVELPITIVNRNGSAPALAADRIHVREGTRVRRVESVATAAETPLTVGLLIDVSDSMQRTLPDVQEAAIRFLETLLGPRDRAFLIAFDSRAHLLQPATSDITLLRRQIMRLRPDGLTALDDAMVLGLLQFEGIKGRRAMIVFTDGFDRTSVYSPDDVRELARRVNVPIHPIASILDVPAALTAAGTNKTDLFAAGHADLQRLADATGGTAHTLRNLADLPNVYAQIETTLRNQILAFARTDRGTRENEWRSVQVKVEGADQVFAPEGYYASW